ncbi:acyltransferase family protein [Arenicella xantha]|uniref:Peptidoglycan/LPS O-acetylase OafA/YrhL n=1 Tax=Arenicella xantha TaxID=644221 RepID=A0A395JGW2_9GAMM|nr:acyltransferase [Arenicella xantha]RBP49210.1 peptidoglycan/LPS O-acetylase OafA/YrhL [Arenicella xantha]
MNELNQKLSKTAYILIVGTFVATYSILTWYFSATVGRVVLEGKFPVGAVVTLEFENYFGGVVRQEIALADRPLRDKQRVSTERINAPVKRFTLAFSLDKVNTPPGKSVVNLYNIQIEQPFSDFTVISKAQLPSFFASDSFFGGRNSYIQLKENSDRSQLTAELESIQALPRAEWYWSVFPALFLSFIVWLVARNHRWSDIPAFRDMSLGRKISTQAEFDSINGIRGLAALLVLFSHAAPGFEAVNMGIAILFVISGFLLSKPFVLNPSQIFDWQKVESYLVKRIKRILPMYYTFIFISYVLTMEFDTAARNFLFVEASGHLWPMTQIFAFYMLLPLVLLLTTGLFRVNKLLPVVVLCAASYLWLQTMSDWQPFYNGRYFKEFYLYAFLLGVAGAYLHFGFGKLMWTDRWPNLLACVVLAALVLAIAWSAPVAPPAFIRPFIASFYGKCVVSLLLIILILRLSHTWLRLLIANPLFRSVGVVGFSFYLLHGLGMQMANHLLTAVLGISETDPRSWTLVVLAFAMTYLMSLISYSYVERPFFGYREAPLNTSNQGFKG